MKLLFDTNIILDILLARQPFLRNAAYLAAEVEHNYIDGYICPVTLTTAEYLLGKYSKKKGSRGLIRNILNIFTLSSLNREVFMMSLDSPLKDFEDAVQLSSARYDGIDAVLTRNLKDFKNSDIPVYHPDEAVQLIRTRLK